MFWFNANFGCPEEEITKNLNTSYVLVQQQEKFNKKLDRQNLNTSYVLVQQIWDNLMFGLREGFKYILCFGSTQGGK